LRARVCAGEAGGVYQKRQVGQIATALEVGADPDGREKTGERDEYIF
jgi:hypothetical protein